MGVRKAGTLNLKKALISIPVCNSKIFILPYEGNFPRNTPSVLFYHPVSLPLLHSSFSLSLSSSSVLIYASKMSVFSSFPILLSLRPTWNEATGGEPKKRVGTRKMKGTSKPTLGSPYYLFWGKRKRKFSFFPTTSGKREGEE